VVSRRSAAGVSDGGTNGVDPVAMTTDFASTRVRSSTTSVFGATNRARPRSRSASGSFSVASTTNPTKRSRCLRTRSRTARPSTRGFALSMPNSLALSIPCAASAAATSNFDGMQPTRAQVVPYGPDSIITTFAPAFAASRRAASPAVPAPITATSTFRVSIAPPCPAECDFRTLAFQAQPGGDQREWTSYWSSTQRMGPFQSCNRPLGRMWNALSKDGLPASSASRQPPRRRKLSPSW
jgi:hypothetical protein